MNVKDEKYTRIFSRRPERLKRVGWSRRRWGDMTETASTCGLDSSGCVCRLVAGSCEHFGSIEGWEFVYLNDCWPSKERHVLRHVSFFGACIWPVQFSRPDTCTILATRYYISLPVTLTSISHLTSCTKGCSTDTSRTFFMTRTVSGGLYQVSLWLAGSCIVLQIHNMSRTTITCFNP